MAVYDQDPSVLLWASDADHLYVLQNPNIRDRMNKQNNLTHRIDPRTDDIQAL